MTGWLSQFTKPIKHWQGFQAAETRHYYCSDAEDRANHRGNILLFFGFNHFNYIFCEFSNQWAHKLHEEKNMSCVCKISVTRSCDATTIGPWHCGLVTAEVSNPRVDYDLHKLEFGRQTGAGSNG